MPYLHIEGKANFAKCLRMCSFDSCEVFQNAHQLVGSQTGNGRYHYIETGSLISIQKNLQNIVIPSVE